MSQSYLMSGCENFENGPGDQLNTIEVQQLLLFAPVTTAQQASDNLRELMVMNQTYGPWYLMKTRCPADTSDSW